MRARCLFFITPIAGATLLCCIPAQAQQAPTELPKVEVISVSPLPGLGVPKEQVPANVQTATAADLERRQALDLSDYLGRALGSVNINGMQNNPFQPDINFRGFTASPLLGTPQGLSVYLDGVRMNQPFGDVVSWDLIPKSAIAKVALMPGSNPLFGLNTLGGALAVTTKDGLTDPGSSVQLLGGSHNRVAAEFESGGGTAAFNWFVTGNRFHERGWRVDSPSDMSQIFGKLGGKIGSADVSLSLAAASNDLTGNGTQEQGALARDWNSVFTIPDNTKNRSQMLNLQLSQPLSQALTLTGNVYYRRIHTNTFNGDLNDDAAGESLYQPSASERAALTAGGYTGFPTSGENASNTPFPKWRCLAAVLLGDDGEPYEKCNGLINRTETNQRNYGFALQVSAKSESQLLLAGVAYDGSRIRFKQGAQFGYLNPDRSITPLDSFADGSLVDDDDNPIDSRVDLSSRSHTTSVYASDTITLNPQTHLTLSGRYNRNTVRNRDAITPGGGTGSLDGDHTFSHFNPAIGITFAASPAFNAYAGINQGSRAPSAIELGCADPASPCKLPNSFAGDPPLKQVITTTIEAGLRGTAGDVAWNVGLFRSDNKDDLLFVSDNAAGFGYFRNFGKTRRQGLELGLSTRPVESLTVGANFTLLDATYRSPETVDGSSNSSNDEAQDGFPGQEGTIAIRPGDRIPNLPRRQFKLYADWAPGAQWHLGIDMTAMSGANARGNENGQYQADGTYYTGSGRSAGYALFNLGADWQPTPKVKLFAQISNLFDRKYATGAQLGGNPFNAAGNYVARPLPRPAGADEFPSINGTFLAPGAPRAFSIGVRYSFD